MRSSLLITTYNRPDALALVLDSAARQSRLPDEVIIADDGSGDATRDMLREKARGYPVPLRHAWHEDRGFRAARVRNLAIAAASGDYMLILDGDMVLHRHYVADHLAAARPGRFIQGMRVLSTAEGAEAMLRERRIDTGFFDPGLERRRHTLRIPPLSALIARLNEGQRQGGIKTCNQGWWRKDLLALNGFDERYEGWGREDNDLAARAYHAGLKRRSLRFAGLAVHLFHPERARDGISANDRLLAETFASPQRIRCELGLDGHLERYRQQPLPDLRAA